jgi:hypothetical protein
MSPLYFAVIGGQGFKLPLHRQHHLFSANSNGAGFAKNKCAFWAQ